MVRRVPVGSARSLAFASLRCTHWTGEIGSHELDGSRLIRRRLVVEIVEFKDFVVPLDADLDKTA